MSFATRHTLAWLFVLAALVGTLLVAELLA